MSRLLTWDRLAPELKDSRRSRILFAVVAVAVTALAVGGTLMGLLIKDSQPGVSMQEFFSYEEFGSAAGSRMVYIPEHQTAVVKGWLMQPLKSSGIYQVWAVRGAEFRSLGMSDAFEYIGFTLVARADLDGVERILITREPPGGSLGQPRGPVVSELLPYAR